ncbi:ParB/RepB/Spo0J family partition protein [Mangrovicoccus algicola]|uniref:ParB/RepB/Spo0J family partition protein n=1 Tax=Mangrovicoccus algicola TaxID=2771008 RepID=A0A8J6YVZ2_9RHOB|nr:ParB/RepB/Spo0J family partition protein [Mangrovicoccus algicola]MBE3638875.1 ParB/RepB/Spo0J family partition protein [Mangrovicoccus algicola]
MVRRPRQAFPTASGDGTEPPKPAQPARRAPMFARGAASLDTAARSAAAEDRMYRNLAVELIDPSPIRDRIDLSENLDELKRSLAEEGQQIPILVRPKPGSDRFEIVTGRRRLQATRELGQATIQAFVRVMSDEEAFVAQGVENNARLETSFIERARTILSALEAGFTQTQVEKFLGTDQTMISRMKSIYTGLGEELVLAIGPARGIGRRKWDRLLALIRADGRAPESLAAIVPADIPDSAERFDAFLRQMEEAAPPSPAPAPAPKPGKPARAARDDGRPLVTERRSDRLVIRTGEGVPPAFLEFVEACLPGLLHQYYENVPGEPGDD